MTAKKVSFGTKPSLTPVNQPDADKWVENRAVEEIKRLTLDLPAGLHTRIKINCALKGVKMADEIRRLLEQHFDELKA